MKNKFLISTTNTIENGSIDRYIDVVSTNIVVGTNIFSDFGASVTDFFGGFSNTYQNKLQLLYKNAIDGITDQARKLGANAIVGLKVDFDEISGKGKSMFMVSAIGTAAQITIKYNDPKPVDKSNLVFSDSLRHELKKKSIMSLREKKKALKADDWDFLFQSPFDEIFPELLELYLNGNEYRENDALALSHFPNYIHLVDRDTVEKTLYSRILEQPEVIIRLINQLDLFNIEEIEKLIKEDHCDIAIDLLASNKMSYNEADIIGMKDILNKLRNIPDKGGFQTKKGMLSQGKEKYYCPSGHQNSDPDGFCVECGLNVKGYTKDHVARMDKFEHKIATISEMLRSPNSAS